MIIEEESYRYNIKIGLEKIIPDYILKPDKDKIIRVYLGAECI
ncbi:hypothetical protein [Metaclostridioides mangenotii]|nr:hypothetical protein [Clostridioides mangenotii]